MNAKAIMDKKFERSKAGYDVEQVDEFLRDVSIEFSELQTQNESLEKKLEVLADKIREYREDEEAIKDALLGAQKQGVRVIAEAKEKAENIIKEATAKSEAAAAEAKEKADKVVAEADALIAEKTAFSKKIAADAEAEKVRLEKESEAKIAELTAKMDAEIKREEEILAKTRAESASFTDKLLGAYKAHIELLKSIPDTVDSDYTKEVSQKFEEAPAAEVHAEISVVEDVKEEEPAYEEVKAEQPVEEAAPIKSETQSIPFQPVFEEAPENSDVDIFETRELHDADEDDSPFFNKHKHHSNYDKLEFGKK